MDQVISDNERQLQRICVTNYLEKWTIFDSCFFEMGGKDVATTAFIMEVNSREDDRW